MAILQRRVTSSTDFSKTEISALGDGKDNEDPVCKKARMNSNTNKMIMFVAALVFCVGFTVFSSMAQDLKIRDDFLGLVKLESCPASERIVCDKSIVSYKKKVKHKIPMLDCEDFSSIGEISQIICVQYDHAVHAAVTVGEDKVIKRTLNASTEYRHLKQTLKNAGIIGRPSTFDTIYKSTVAGLGIYLENELGDETRKLDGNKGDKLWEYAVLKMFNRFTTDLQHAYYLTEAMKVDTSGMVISSSTALASDTAQEPVYEASKNVTKEFTDAVVDRDVPTLILGIGFLLDYQEIDQKSLQKLEFADFQTKFLLEVEDRGSDDDTPNIGVYGKFTERVCNNSGIKSCIALGCPTLTLSREPSLGKLLATKWKGVAKSMEQQEQLEIVLVLPELNGQGFVGAESRPHKEISKLYANICKEHICTFVVQNESTDKQHFLAYDHAIKSVYNAPFNTFQNDVHEWLDFVRDKDFVVSCRIRGGMAGISTGVPTIIIPTDYRIQEATEEMKIPKVSINQVIENKYTSFSELFRDAKVDFKSFEINRRDKISIYKKMMNKSGFQMDPTLESILDAPLGF